MPSRENLETDATETLKRLLALKTEDSNWIVVPKIEGKGNRLIALFWISPLQVSLWTQFYNIVLTNNTCKTNRYEMAL